MLLLQMDFQIWKRRRDVFADKVGSKTWPCDKITIVYCPHKC